MSCKRFTFCLIMIIVSGLLLSPVCLASGGEVTDVERHVPESIVPGEAAEITLRITGEKPFIAGIVESIPRGFTFPENDGDVSGSQYFKMDRDAGKISFAVSDESEVSYKIIPSSNEGVSFEGYWVDMLLRTPELDQGKETCWIPVTDPHVVSGAQGTGTVNGGQAGHGHGHGDGGTCPSL